MIENKEKFRQIAGLETCATDQPQRYRSDTVKAPVHRCQRIGKGQISCDCLQVLRETQLQADRDREVLLASLLQAERDRLAFQEEIRRIWEYLRDA
ncbi:hypothetical protein H6G94_33160 [Nostoc punctiforme FACHB-252]|uniref:Uncharacterized protein n=1 Tax=Nostoc punctiforme FACHB-252 TaxID=1357509 RepID=A0ABR8HM39_NOSPU|nr:hypothetical protein [Nostoc punctiforme]MBD2616040.1 hypothetical protein [Nostoc punctiforme FACHB-252]